MCSDVVPGFRHASCNYLIHTLAGLPAFSVLVFGFLDFALSHARTHTYLQQTFHAVEKVKHKHATQKVCPLCFENLFNKKCFKNLLKKKILKKFLSIEIATVTR